MDDPSQAGAPPSVTMALLVLVAASVVAGLGIAVRWWRGAPVVPYERRRAVPWRLMDVLIVLVLFELVAPLLVVLVGSFLAGTSRPDPPVVEPAAAEPVDVQHPVVDLLNADPGPATWLLCILVAVVVAPVAEEFAYRLVLQGWLEAEERRVRRWLPEARRLVPGLIPVVTVSTLFALRHFRTASAPIEPEVLKQQMLSAAVASLAAFGLAVLVLRVRSGATLADFGFDPKKLLGDAGLGVFLFAAIGAPILLVQLLATKFVFPNYVAADPVPLFLLAAVLGIVYYRTHRITPAVVIHAALNATSLGLAWLQL